MRGKVKLLMCRKPISGLPGTIAVATHAHCSARARNTFASCRLVCCRSASSGIETRRPCRLLFCCCRCVARFRNYFVFRELFGRHRKPIGLVYCGAGGGCWGDHGARSHGEGRERPSWAGGWGVGVLCWVNLTAAVVCLTFIWVQNTIRFCQDSV